MGNKVFEAIRNAFLSKNPGVLESETAAPLKHAHVLTEKELGDLNQAMKAGGQPPLADGAAGIVFGRDMTQIAIIGVVFGFIPLLLLYAFISLTHEYFTYHEFGKLVKAVFCLGLLCASVAVYVLAGILYKKWIIMESERIRVRTAFGPIALDNIIPYDTIDELRYERGNAQRNSGVFLLLKSGEWLQILILSSKRSGSRVSDNNAGFLTRAISQSSGLPIKGDIHKDGLGDVDAPFDFKNPPLEPTGLSPEINAALFADTPSDYTLFTRRNDGIKSVKDGFSYMLDTPRFAVRADRRCLSGGIVHTVLAAVAGVWALHAWPEFRALLENIIETPLNEQAAWDMARSLLPAIVFILCASRAWFMFFRGNWLIFLDDTLDIYEKGGLHGKRLARIAKSRLARVETNDAFSMATLSLVRSDANPYRVPWVKTVDEAKWLGRIVSAWLGGSPTNTGRTSDPESPGSGFFRKPISRIDEA